MLLKKTNIAEQLQKLKHKTAPENTIISAVKHILKKDADNEKQILNTLNSSQFKACNSFNFDLLDTAKIYHISHIKTICINYRLRFLDSKFFKGEIPYEAISKIKTLEKNHNIKIEGYKIMAPSKLFELQNADDPLLFAPMGNDYFYLVHKWGNDLHPLRKWLMWPYKNLANLIITTLMVSLLATAIFPEGIFSNESNASQAGMIFFFMFKSIGAMVIYYGFAAGKNFNSVIWNSKYFN